MMDSIVRLAREVTPLIKAVAALATVLTVIWAKMKVPLRAAYSPSPGAGFRDRECGGSEGWYDGSPMANQEHLEILARGVTAWNEWRASWGEIKPDLQGADLRQISLRGSNFQNTDLRRALLDRASLVDADFRSATLARAQLTGADLFGAIFSGASLLYTNLRRSSLPLAIFDGSILAGADLTESVISGTVFGNVTLTQCIGLDTVEHRGPSTIGIDTIYRSHGSIPESFLRGAGVPEDFIAHMRSITRAALDFYSVFISYSTKDQDFAERLHADLRVARVRCWFAAHDIQGGKKVHEQIGEAVGAYDKLLVILSESSMNSNWVKTEIANARAKEQNQKQQVLFPIGVVPFDRIKEWRQFDADTGTDSAREIREHFIPDFSNWKDPAAYQKAFDRLLHDLAAQHTP